MSFSAHLVRLGAAVGLAAGVLGLFATGHAPGHPVAPAGAAGTVTITVNRDGTGVAGAFVALRDASGNGRYGGVSGDGTGGTTLGQVVLTGVADGAYTAVASAPGTTVGAVAITVVGDDPSASITVADTGNRFVGLGAYGSQTGTIVADGRSGVFYLNTTAIPSLYRTADHGGTWAPVTLSNDDPAFGLDGSTSVGSPATSGHPGEIAAVGRDKIWYSRDFGVTWSSLSLPSGLPQPRLHWGHVGGTSVLFAVDDLSTAVHYAVMPTSTTSITPTGMTAMAGSYKSSPADRSHVANGSAAPFFAVAAGAGGDVTLYEVDLTPSSADSKLTVPGAAPAGLPTFVRIGGPASGPAVGAGNTPNSILVYQDNTGLGAADARLSSYASGAWTTTTTLDYRREDDTIEPSGSLNNGPSSCGGQPGAIGAVSPLGGFGTVASCWLQQSGTTLVVRRVNNVNNNTGFAFDAGYDGTTNKVIISGDGSKGAVKSASEASNRPFFPIWPQRAAAGTAPASGGVSIEGIDSAVVRDTRFGPTAQDIVAMMSFSGGGRTIGSNDGGATWQTLDARGGESIEYFAAATPGTYWIVAGSSGAGNLLGAATVTSTGVLSTTTIQHFDNTPNTRFGLTGTPEGAAITALLGISGTNTVWAGASNGSSGTLSNVAMTPGSSSVTITSQGPRVGISALAGITNPVNALAYCPTGSLPIVADKLFVALGETQNGKNDGGLAVVGGASTAAPVVTRTVASGSYTDVRTACGLGVVWAGRGRLPVAGPGGAFRPIPLDKSTDGAITFSTVSITDTVAAALPDVATFTVNKDTGKELVAVSANGSVLSSGDGGSTWDVKNDSAKPNGRSFGNERPGNVEIPPPVTRTVTATVQIASGAVRPQSTISPNAALLGTGAGLFSANVRAASAPPTAAYTANLPVVMNAATHGW